MSNQLNPYLFFNGDAREAMTFYQSVFGGDLEIMTFGDQGMEGPDADKVMHSYLGSPTVNLMGSDAPPGTSITRGNNVGLSLSGDGGGELRGWFDALADGGETQVPLEKQAWGDEFGQIVDRFGVIWLVNISQPDGTDGAR
jgi:PhnB protein